MTEGELKPCPFCGNKPQGPIQVGDETGEGYVAIECGTCTGSSGMPFCGVHGDDDEQVAAAWNNRARKDWENGTE